MNKKILRPLLLVFTFFACTVFISNGSIQTIDHKDYLTASAAQPLLAAVDIRPKDDLKKSSQSNRKVKKDKRKSRREIRKAKREARKEFRKQKRQHRKNLRRDITDKSAKKNIGYIILLSFGIAAGIFIILIGIIILDLSTVSSAILIATLGILLGLLIIFLSIRGIRKVHK